MVTRLKHYISRFHMNIYFETHLVGSYGIFANKLTLKQYYCKCSNIFGQKLLRVSIWLQCILFFVSNQSQFGFDARFGTCWKFRRRGSKAFFMQENWEHLQKFQAVLFTPLQILFEKCGQQLQTERACCRYLSLWLSSVWRNTLMPAVI